MANSLIKWQNSLLHFLWG